MVDLTDIFSAIVALLGVIVTTFLVPYIKQKFSVEQLSEIKEVINIAVWAAEMLYQGVGRGEEKKAYVYDCINKFLAQHKLKIDLQVIENMIESAVLNMKNTIVPDSK